MNVLRGATRFEPVASEQKTPCKFFVSDVRVGLLLAKETPGEIPGNILIRLIPHLSRSHIVA